MIKVLGFSVLVGLLASTAHAVSLADCGEYSSELNKSFPHRVDKLTTVGGTTCVPGKKRPVLMYRMLMDIEKAEANVQALESMRQSQLRTWCSEPNQLELFKLVDIKYSYIDRSGRFIGEINHAIESCPR
jgi:hypothetical protein